MIKGGLMSKSFLRNVIGEHMTILGKNNKQVVIVNADLAGTCRNKKFIDMFPERSFNTGIAEQNMVSFAAGLACEGFIPYVFSMAPFLIMRACEQCRTDVAYGNRNVRLIGVYAGVSGGISGATHWAIEDIGIMTSIPGVSVFEVSDANMAKNLLDYSLQHEGPMYIRSSVEPTEDIYPEDIVVKPGCSIIAREGDDGAILCSGVMVQYALVASCQIEERTGKKIRVVDLYSLKPIDRMAILDAAKTGLLLVVQDHNIYGGLGSIVAKEIVEMELKVRYKVLGIPDRFVAMAHAGYLYEKFNMNSHGIAETIYNML